LNNALTERFNWPAENRDVWDGPPSASENSSVSAYVTIMRGCNFSCTYCIVPSVRGRELYRPMNTILDEVRERVASGAREIILLGQTVNSYRSDGADFADLLRAVDAVDGLKRIRFMSPHPYFLNDRMIRAMADCDKICRHLHLPLQSGSDRILRRMRRNYTVREFLDKVERLRRAVPDIAFTTDVIAGFPGETEQDFDVTLKVLETFDPCSAYCFKFSARPGTDAAAFEDPIPEVEIERRQLRLLKAVESRMQSHLNSWIGREVQLLMENEREGHIEHYFSARLEQPRSAGQLVPCVVTAASRTGLNCKNLEMS
jgi:tRNA-2-methylthio-N6-dimethylallyladenosine synthase